MVADEYFDLRSRLGGALFSLGRAADLAGLKPSRTPMIKSLVEGLRDPFVFVVAGEVNAGKSTLLNALFGEEFCRTGVLPETACIHYFRYGRSPLRRMAGPLLEEVELPHAFLRDFHVVDTPGVNSIAEGHELITSEFIPRADAVLYCFPATNPWSGSSWEFLGRIQQAWLKKVVLVLQQSDLRTAEETAAIAEHMQATAMQRLGVRLPVFPVSARMALLARTSGLDKARLLADSAFPVLEDHLAQMVAASSARLGKLITACSAGQATLAEVQASVAASASALEGLVRLGGGVQLSLDQAHRALQNAIGEIIVHLGQTWQELVSTQLSAALGERRSFPGLLLGKDPAAGTVPARLLPPLLSAVRKAGDDLDCQIHSTLSALWAHPGETLHLALGGGAPREAEPPWQTHKAIFIAALENAACDAVAGSGLAEWWQERLRGRRGTMRGLVLAGVLSAAAAAASSTGAPGVALCFGILLVVCVVAGKGILRRETRQMAEEADPLTESARDIFLARARGQCLAHVQAGLAEFAPWTAPLTKLIAKKEAAAAPLAEEVAQLALTFQTLSRTLHGSQP